MKGSDGVNIANVITDMRKVKNLSQIPDNDSNNSNYYMEKKDKKPK